MRLVDAYDIILLDQGKTFMFGNDRLGPNEDYNATYRRVGGTELSENDIQTAVSRTHTVLLNAYCDGVRDDCFQTVQEAALEADLEFPELEIDLLDDLIAEHEIGSISDAHRRANHSLAATHRLGIIPNIRARPSRFEQKLQQVGLFDCFEYTVWSSTYRKSKPSRHLFDVALDYWQIEPEHILYVGNDPLRDVTGAKAAGMGAAWINVESDRLPEGCSTPDVSMLDLCDLESLETGEEP